MSTSRITIDLEIDGEAADAYHVVDALLDAGFLQDAINDHDADAGELKVLSAVVRLTEQAEVWERVPPGAKWYCLMGDETDDGPCDETAVLRRGQEGACAACAKDYGIEEGKP